MIETEKLRLKITKIHFCCIKFTDIYRINLFQYNLVFGFILFSSFFHSNMKLIYFRFISLTIPSFVRNLPPKKYNKMEKSPISSNKSWSFHSFSSLGWLVQYVLFSLFSAVLYTSHYSQKQPKQATTKNIKFVYFSVSLLCIIHIQNADGRKNEENQWKFL